MTEEERVELVRHLVERVTVDEHELQMEALIGISV